jgi:hypothetical protein
MAGYRRTRLGCSKGTPMESSLVHTPQGPGRPRSFWEAPSFWPLLPSRQRSRTVPKCPTICTQAAMRQSYFAMSLPGA